MRDGFCLRFRVSGLGVEKLLNAAGQQGILLRRVQRETNRDVTVFCSPSACRAFRALAEEKGYQVSDARPVGLLYRLEGLAKRKGLLIGWLLAVALIVYALGFVWQVRIENAGPYEGEVRSFLEELGVRPGVRRSEIRLGELREKLEWRLPRVKWVRTDWAGVALRIRLEEGVPPPDRETDEPADLVATEDGILKRLTAYAGTPQAKPGDPVRSGQVLIKGEERGKNGETVPVRARGEAIARVWVSVQTRMPLAGYVSLPTGRETVKRRIGTPFFTWPGADGPDYLTADAERRRITVGGAWLPVWIERERWIEVQLVKNERNIEEVKQEGKKAANLALNRALTGHETVDKWFDFSMIEGDIILVTATAEILRDIGGPGP